MFKKISSSIIFFTVIISTFLSAEIEYDIQDIGTLQTHSSQAIALNNQGEILGWYYIDGSRVEKKFFVCDRDRNFHGVPTKENGVRCDIDWKYLTDDGKVYGTVNNNTDFAVLYMWDQHNGVVSLGNIPGKEIVKINNVGQVLISSIAENENGRFVRRPVIWENGKITKLNGLEGNACIESDYAYGYDMNNKGEVVGYSRMFVNHKNNIHAQQRATKWVNGNPIDLNKTVHTGISTVAIAINDLGEVLFNEGYFINKDGQDRKFQAHMHINTNYIYSLNSSLTNVYKTSGELVTNIYAINRKIMSCIDSIWVSVYSLGIVNDNGEIIAQGTTIYGEQHAMLLTPVNPQ